MIRGPRAALIAPYQPRTMSGKCDDVHKRRQHRHPGCSGRPRSHHLEDVWQGRQERRFFSVTTRGSQCLECLERRFNQRTRGLVLDDAPNEADEVDDRRLTLLAQLFSDEWHSGRNDAKRPRLDLVCVPSVYIHEERSYKRKTHPRIL